MQAIIKTHKKLTVGKPLKAAMTGRYKIIKSWKGEILEETDWRDNLIMNSDTHGVNLIVREMIGDHTYSIEVTHAKIGTGTTPPDETDTDLEEPTTIGTTDNPSILRGDQLVVGTNIAQFQFFISDGDIPNDAYTEWGLFTGEFGVNEKMMARALISPAHNKGTNQDTTIIHEVEVTNEFIGS